MRSRISYTVLILIVVVSLKPTKPVSADSGCDTSVHYTIPSDLSKTPYTISASKTYPARPVVKQQLEELAARGDLSQGPDFYDSIFTATVSLEPGTARWNHAYTTDEWEYYYSGCTTENVCPGKWKIVNHCDAQPPVVVYRSIQTINVFLIPSAETLDWYWNWNQSPTVMNAYPDYWVLVTIAEGGVVSWVPKGSSGLHFYYSVPLRDAMFFLPSKLHQDFVDEEIINPGDKKFLPKSDIMKFIPLCKFDSGNITKYEYEQRYNLNTDIDQSAYDCQSTTPQGNTSYQSVTLTISKYDFDIPGTFYIGVVTQLSPAILPPSTPNLYSENLPRTEPVVDPTSFQPSNIILPLTDPTSYGQTIFTVWMIVSTPCWTEDGGCNIENPPK